jgi:hypothetical protein
MTKQLEIPRNHHFLPVFHLKEWVGADDQLCEMRRVRPGLIVDRRKYPDATGYEKDLYRLDGVPLEKSVEVERTFMHHLDTLAADAMRSLKQRDFLLTNSRLRSTWVRYLLSMLLRVPETVSDMKATMSEAFAAGLEKARETYPEERVSQAAKRLDVPSKAALKVLIETINNPRLGPIIFDMAWDVVHLERASKPLMISDRPLEQIHGLGDQWCCMILPLGPKHLFVAEHIPNVAIDLAKAKNQNRIVTAYNRGAIERAHTFVWATDKTELALVRRFMSANPSRRIVTAVNRSRTIEAAKEVEPSSNTRPAGVPGT